MILPGRPAKILLIDTNVYFSKRLSDALKREGFEVTTSTQPAFALTTLEYDAPTAIVCSTNMREMGALDIARMIRADAKNAAMPIIALGDGSQRALMEAFQAGCDDYIDRTRTPAALATHIRNIIVSKSEGFQPTQMLPQADTSLSGSLSHHDLPGVMQMLGHAHQTGALHINSGETDALLFFDAGTVTHAECGALFGDEAVIHILKSCFKNNSGVYKFVYGSASAQHTVLRSSTDLMLDAMREVDESARESEEDLLHDFSKAPAEPSGEIEIAEEPAVPTSSSQTSDHEPAIFGGTASEARFETQAAEVPEGGEALPESDTLTEESQIEPSVISSEDSVVAERSASQQAETILPNATEIAGTPDELQPDDDAPSVESFLSSPIEPVPSESSDLEYSAFVDSLIDQECGTSEFPPSEGYFFADRKQAEESPTPLSGDSPESHRDDSLAISHAIDSFAIRHSNDFSAAPVSDNDASPQETAQQATRISETPATDDSSVVSGSEEAL